MKNWLVLGSVALVMFFASCETMKQVASEARKRAEAYQSNKPLTNSEVVSGLREALKVGAEKAAAKTSKTDGFYKNALIKIPFPDEAIKVKKTAESLGMKKQVDQFVMTLNRAAEEASKQAVPVFWDAIKGMSIQDGFKILKGGDNAATDYLRSKTTAKLTTKFSPITKKAVDKVEVTKYWNPLSKAYNSIPGIKKVNPDLDKYVTEQAINGLFKMVAKEEALIRKDPVARVSEILKRVFGSQQ